MKNQMLKTLMLGAVAAALVVTPAISQAQDASAPAASSTTKKPTFHGKASAVDTAAMTLTVGTNTITITSDTKITKNGKPATLSDVQVNDMVMGTYTVGADGKLNATALHDGVKAKKKKKTSDDSSSTNAPAATGN
jgi:hypothetical protein